MTHTPTERQAARAAKQLHYHRERLRWMQTRLRYNEALLLLYLTHQDAPTAILPGGYRITDRTPAFGGLDVEKLAPRNPFEQLILIRGA